ncbi:MAG TPA: DUF389 domain-containing protein [Candidatus Coprenecus stercorigallinarum]|nr:DUF389 domain-containing protein [Candidatus Coprenecus stercorigallinarum]
MDNNFKTFFSKARDYLSDIVSLNDHIDTDKASQYIRSNIDFKGPNAYILAFAIVVASVGLNINSIPVIIGAMLISPLMGPIFGIGYGLGTNDTSFLKTSFKNLVVMVVISIIASGIFFLISPLELENPTELLARTNPTIYDVLIALFGGFAGIIEISRKEKGTVISGVAIATALMPPLCTAGFGLATGSLKYFAGAMYLFFINSIFIAIATFLTVKYLKFPMATFTDPTKKKRVSRWIAVLTVVIIIPSVYSAIIMIRENNFNQTAKEFISQNKELANSYIYDYGIYSHSKPPKLELFIAGEALNQQEISALYRSAHEFGLTDDQIIISQRASSDQKEMTDRVAIQSIYERSDQEIRKREEVISDMRKELQEYKSRELPYEQITNELMAQYPSLSDVTLTRGYSLSTDSLGRTEEIIIILSAEKTISKENLEKLRKWLMVRLDFKNIKLLQE